MSELDMTGNWYEKCMTARYERDEARAELKKVKSDFEQYGGMAEWEREGAKATEASLRTELERTIEARDEARRVALHWYKEALKVRKTARRTATYGDLFLPKIDDGFGNRWYAWCTNCGGDMQIIRPGDARCARCGK